MPLYEYRCTACGHVFEKIQSFSAPDEKECPKCAGAVERLLSAPAIQFKGSGFYLTDYGKSGSSSKGDSKSEAGSSKDSGSGSSDSGSSSSGSNESSNAKATPKADSGSSSSQSGSSGASNPSSGGAKN